MADNNDTSLKRIGRYELKERIGTGGMARVYRASDTTLDRDVAVKVLHEHLADDDLFRARFEREAKFVASFNHPNVIQIFDYATIEKEDEYLCYMVMTYLPGKTLKAFMDDTMESGDTMPTDRVLRITQGIAAALDYAHELGMVHRDIKPANILFDERDQAVLTDFGIARLAESSRQLTQENVAIGTPAYMAPEQAAGEKVDARTDIYAFGVILYELLAGQPPFKDDGSISILIKHLNSPVPPLTDLDHIDNTYLDAVVIKAMAKDPSKRYQRAGDLADDLARALAGQQPMALEGDTNQLLNSYSGAYTPVSRKEKPDEPSPASGNTAPLRILVVGLLAIIAVLVVGYLVNNRPVTVVMAPTMQQPPIPTATATLDPADFRNLGGIDSMVQEEDEVSSMTSAADMGFATRFDPEDDIAEVYWSYETTMSGTRPGEISRSLTEDGQYRMTNSIRNLVATSIVDQFSYTEDITIRALLALGEGSDDNSGYGLVFHYQDQSNYGVFAVDGEGRYSIWFLEDGSWRELRDIDDDWTESDAILPIGAQNEVRLDIRGETLTGYINETQVVEVTDPALKTGGVGVYLANPNRDEAVAELFVDMYEVVVVSEEGDNASSMTDS